MDSLPGGMVIGGKYVISELLGTGGMGHVYHARHIKVPEFQVAIKVLDPAFTLTVENKDRFRNEVIAGYRANHLNVVQMYEYFDLGTLQAFAMEYVDGGTLFELMADGPVPVDLSLSFVKQIAAGLGALHRGGTHHRDLKPENVMLTCEGVAKLTDFGIARVRGGPKFDDEGQLAGTPKYAAPEYVENGESDHRGDIYALGVIAFELISGSSPFKAITSKSLLKERLEPHGLDLAERIPGLPTEIVALVQRCMAVHPFQRFSHANDIADAVTAIQKQYGMTDSIDVDASRKATRIIWSEVIHQIWAEQLECAGETEGPR